MTDDQMEQIKDVIGTAVAGLREETRTVIGGLREETRTAISGLREEVHRIGVTVEGLRGEIRQVAEGVANLDETLDREVTELRQEMKSGFADVTALVKVSYGDLDRRVRILEGNA